MAAPVAFRAHNHPAQSEPTVTKRPTPTTTAVVLAGPVDWCMTIDSALYENEKLTVAGTIRDDLRRVRIYDAPQGDVVIIHVDGTNPDFAIEFARQMQAKVRSTCIALILPEMEPKSLRLFDAYSGSWSLISTATCDDYDLLGRVLESAGRGIPWVDTEINRRLSGLMRFRPEARPG